MLNDPKMKPDVKYQIEYILNSLKRIHPDTLSAEGIKLDVGPSSGNGGQQMEATQRLSQYIYMQYYCKGTAPQLLNDTSNPDGTGTDYGAFLEKLRSANKAAESFGQGWIVHSVEKNGSIIAQKYNFLKRVMPGDYIKEGLGNVYPGDRVKIVARKEWAEENGSFYYVFGDTISDGDGMGLARVYINIHPEGSERLIGALNTCFNKYQIPFQFKCINHPSHYGRADSSVLYLEKRFVRAGLQALARAYPKIRQHIRTGVPLFCKELGAGIGFAENPPNPAESFGMSRSSLIAQGVMKAIASEERPDSWLDTVMQFIEDKNLSVGQFYLNPNASFPYQLIDFNQI